MTQTAHGVEFTQQLSATPKLLKSVQPSWPTRVSATISPTTPPLSTQRRRRGQRRLARCARRAVRTDLPRPAAAVLHYAQEIFEGLKAYRHADGSIWTFRPEANAARLNKSARRLALPELPAETSSGHPRAGHADKEWVPSGEGEALYLRPFMIATEAFLGVRAAREVSFRVIASPAGDYFGGGSSPCPSGSPANTPAPAAAAPAPPSAAATTPRR